MRVLVTGSRGFFASWLLPALSEHEITGYDIKDGDDLFDEKHLLEKMRGQDAVIHLAAYPHFYDDVLSQRYTRRNIIGTANVVNAMLKARVRRLVYVSSGAVYGFGPDRPPEGWVTPPITEEKAPGYEEWAVMDVYSASKLACESWPRCVPQIHTTILRVNCIEPFHEGAAEQGAHWGWWCSQALAIRAIRAGLVQTRKRYWIVNVGEENPNVDRTQLEELLCTCAST